MPASAEQQQQQQQQEQPIVSDNQEHDLQTGWALWYDRKMPKKTDAGTYQSNLRKIGSFSTVEEFWR